MKVRDVIEANEWDNMAPPQDPEEFAALQLKRRDALEYRDMMLARRLEALMSKSQNAVFLGVFPSQNDDDAYHSDEYGTPGVVAKAPDDFVEIPLNHVWFCDDEVRTGEPYDDAHERFYVRKNRPDIVKLVKQLVNRHNAVRRMSWNTHQWLYGTYSAPKNDM